MKRLNLLLALLFSLALLASCGSSDDDGDGRQQQEEDQTTGAPGNAGANYDSEISPEERDALNESTSAINTYGIDGGQVRSFSQIFGGTRSADVARYFDERVNYIISETTDVQSRLVEGEASALPTDNAIFARNPSASLWYVSKINEPRDVRFEVNNSQVDITSSRIGVMQIGDAFVDSETALQAATLVHEARHSDCTGGALASDLRRIENGQAPSNLLCGHLHGECPAGHVYEGTFGCDTRPWGAYIVDLVYSLAVSETCATCSEADRQAAEINALDVIQRPTYDIEDLFNGEFGPPDMSSSTTVR